MIKNLRRDAPRHAAPSQPSRSLSKLSDADIPICVRSESIIEEEGIAFFADAAKKKQRTTGKSQMLLLLRVAAFLLFLMRGRDSLASMPEFRTHDVLPSRRSKHLKPADKEEGIWGFHPQLGM
jgi:hypothetical protein